MDKGNVIQLSGFCRAEEPDSGESQKTMTPKFDYVLRADTADPQGRVKRRLACDNYGWQVEVRDDNLQTVNICKQEWGRNTAAHLKREKSIVYYHKLADIIAACRSQYGSASAAGSSAGAGAGGAGGAAGGKGSVNCKSANFYGVVVDHTHPRKTSGTHPHARTRARTRTHAHTHAYTRTQVPTTTRR